MCAYGHPTPEPGHTMYIPVYINISYTYTIIDTYDVHVHVHMHVHEYIRAYACTLFSLFLYILTFD